MNPVFFGITAFALLLPGWTRVAAAAHDSATAHAPTRLQLCQQEVGEQSGEPRKRALRDCLTRRNQGEAGIAADCRRQLRIGTHPSAVQQQQLRGCEARALAVPSQQLPRRAVPRAAPVSSSSPAAAGFGR